MRILHTSDWHLGRSFAEHRMLDEQSLALDWMVDLVRAEGVEVVVVAGDLFDRSLPPADAWELLWGTFRRLVGAGAVVVAVAGNHDSPERLGATRGLTEVAGVHLRGGHRQAAEPVVLQVPGGALAVAPVPFLDPRLLPSGGEPQPSEAPDAERGPVPASDDDRPGTTGELRSHESVLARALQRCRTGIPAGVPSVAVAHAFVTGATPSGSERELAVGEATMVSSSVFEGFDYVALGHMHSAQSVGGAPHVRYSGSPLAYSFSEATPKEVALVDLTCHAPARLQRVTVEVGRGVRTVRGTLDDLLTGPVDAGNWVRAELTDNERPTDAARRLRHVFPWLAEVEWTAARRLLGGAGDAPLAGQSRVEPHVVAAEFWQVCTGELPGDEESAVLAEVLAPPTDGASEVAA
jgi:exonuclease SbcD